MAEKPEKQTLIFRGERVTWISPGTLKDLLELKAKHPEAPLISGNTSLGEWLQRFSRHHQSRAQPPVPYFALRLKHYFLGIKPQPLE